MDAFAVLSCSLCLLVFLFAEQVKCLPLVVKNSTRTRAPVVNRTASTKETLLTYADLPDDGSLDDRFLKQHREIQGNEDELFAQLSNEQYYEGDIKLDPLTRLYMEVDRNLPPRRKRAVARDRTKRWKGGVIPFTIDRKLPAKTKFAIRQAIRHWKAKTNKCLTFRRKLPTDQDFIHFYDDGEACWSNVGRIGNQQNISIAERCVSIGVVIHEIGHAVGFYHEQARRDREKYIAVLTRNINPFDRPQFRRLGHRDVDSMGFAYDYWSIMHYGPKAYSWNKKETIRIRKVGRKVGAVIGMRELSKLDIAQIRAMYQCNPVPSIESRKGCFKSKHGDGREYRGTLDYTETGITCQYWSDNYPHRHSKNLRKHGLGNHNYCRNPGGRRLRPWCFTTKTNHRWQYCDVKVCRG